MSLTLVGCLLLGTTLLVVAYAYGVTSCVCR